MRILIAEDDLTSRSMLAAVLKKAGHEITATVNGVEALAVLEQPGAPRLAILDWMMPEMDGLEVVRRIRAKSSPQPPYLIMLTAKGEKADIIAGLDAGADDYLAKPFDTGELRARVEVGRRIVELQEALFESREILAHQASHDTLTGLLNRRAILERLHEECARAARHGSLVAIGICDIDHFKQVNDTHGHQVGDDVLIGLAQLLTQGVRPYDAVGRMGGEEFLVVAPMEAGIDPLSLFQRLCTRIADHAIGTRGGHLRVTASFGIACAGTTPTEALLAAADRALYQAKSQGRNRVAADDSLPGQPFPERSGAERP